MQALIGWTMLASWIATIWMMWKIVQEGRAAVRGHRTPLRVKAGVPRRNRSRG
jgi:hypothetical protein